MAPTLLKATITGHSIVIKQSVQDYICDLQIVVILGLLCRVPSINFEFCAGDTASLITEQKHDGSGNLFRVCHPLHRMRFDNLFDKLIMPIRQNAGVGSGPASLPSSESRITLLW